MKSIHDILTEYGLTVPEEKKAEFDKAVTENYKTVADYDKQAGKLALAEDKVRTAADALKKFEGVDVTALQGEITTLKNDLAAKDSDYQAKLAEMEFNTLLDGAITKAGAVPVRCAVNWRTNWKRCAPARTATTTLRPRWRR